MMLRFALGERAAANAIERAVVAVIDARIRTGDIWSEGCTPATTSEMGEAIANAVN